MPSNRFLNFI